MVGRESGKGWGHLAGDLNNWRTFRGVFTPGNIYEERNMTKWRGRDLNGVEDLGSCKPP